MYESVNNPDNLRSLTNHREPKKYIWMIEVQNFNSYTCTNGDKLLLGPYQYICCCKMFISCNGENELTPVVFCHMCICVHAQCMYYWTSTQVHMHPATFMFKLHQPILYIISLLVVPHFRRNTWF